MKIDGIYYEMQKELEDAIFFWLSDGRDKNLRRVARIIAELCWRLNVLEK